MYVLSITKYYTIDTLASIKCIAILLQNSIDINLISRLQNSDCQAHHIVTQVSPSEHLEIYVDGPPQLEGYTESDLRFWSRHH